MGTVLVRIARLAFAGLGIAAIVAAITATAGGLGNFFSYFTIEANLLAIVVLIAGAATLFMVITGIVYAALLANAEVGLTAAWIDDTLHRVLPLVMLADWIFFPPWGRGSYRAALGWAGWPGRWPTSATRWRAARSRTGTRTRSSTRGTRAGTGRVALYAVVLAVAMALLALGVNVIGRRRGGSPGRHRVTQPS